MSVMDPGGNSGVDAMDLPFSFLSSFLSPPPFSSPLLSSLHSSLSFSTFYWLHFQNISRNHSLLAISTAPTRSSHHDLSASFFARSASDSHRTQKDPVKPWVNTHPSSVQQPPMALTSFGVKAKVLTVAHQTWTVQPPSPLRPRFLLSSPLSLCSSHTGLVVVPVEGLCLRTFALASPSQECSSPKYSHDSLSLLWSLLKHLLVGAVFPLFKMPTTLTHFQSLSQFIFSL